MKKSLSGTQSFGIMLLLALVAAGVHVGGYMLIRRQVVENEEARASVESQRATLQQLAAVEQLVDETILQRSALAGYFVNDDTIPDFLNYLESVAEFMGVTLQMNSISIETGTSVLRTSFITRGSHEAVVGFMDVLQSLPFYTTIERSDLRIFEDSLEVYFDGVAEPESAAVRGWENDVDLRVESFIIIRE